MSGNTNEEATNLKINLSKQVVIDLVKKKGIEGQKANVILCLDFSGSMSMLYSNGFVQQVLERIIPIAMAFDDDQSMPVYIFHDTAYRVLPDVTIDNVHGYVRNNITSKYSYGSTCYAPPIDLIVKKFVKDNGAATASATTESGFFNGVKNFFSPKKQETNQVTAKLPTYVIFITDGENNPEDKSPAQQAIIDASKHGIFFQFVGLKSSRDTNFSFLTKLDKMTGRFIDNANFFEIKPEEANLDAAKPDAYLTDKQLYEKLLDEFPSWTKEAASKGLIEPNTVTV